MGYFYSQFFFKYPFVLLTGFLVTYLMTPLVQRLAAGMGAIDMPDERRVHDHPVPRNGGLAVFFGFHAGCAAVFLMPWASFDGQLGPLWWSRFLTLSTMLLCVGLVDDIRGMRATTKLGAQIIVAILAFMFDMKVGRVLGLTLPWPVDLVATLVWFVAIINAFNLIDGMDGVAAGLAGIAALGLAGSFSFRHLPGDSLVVIGLVGSCIAFLRYNFHPAQIFLGDSGSMFLGFCLAAIALSTGAKDTAVAAIGVPLLAFGIPVFDAALAVWRRTARRLADRADGDAQDTDRGKLFAADMEHLHHRLHQSGLSSRTTALSLYGAAIILIGVGLLSLIYQSRAVGIYLIAFLAASYVVVRHIARAELWDSGRAILGGLRRPHGRVLPFVIYPPLDILCLTLALAFAVYLGTPGLGLREFKVFWFDQVPLWVGLPFLAMFAFKVYSRVWGMARVSEYALLALVLTAGILAASAVTILTGGFRPPFDPIIVDMHETGNITLIVGNLAQRGLILQTVIYTGVAAFLVAGLRALPRVIADGLLWHPSPREDANVEKHHVLICGAGRSSALFLTRSLSQMAGGRKAHVVVAGILDDDRNFHGHYIHGYRVLGGIDDVEEAVRKHHVEEIVITKPVTEEKLDRLRAVARSEGIRLAEWRATLQPLEDGGGS